ncbi:MAG: hypothetical protein IJ649_05320 [Oscillospiraceae bacterium]|nr:hypothetical protein [Oscillospiraceae bacterium]
MNKKCISFVIMLSLLLTLGMASAFADNSYAPGPTVLVDADSPTGYSVEFVYDTSLVDPEALGLKDIAAVTLYSDCMKLYTYEEQTAGTIDGAFGHLPEEYAEGMYPAGGSGATRLDVALEKISDTLFCCRIPLSSGAFVYNYTLTDSEGTSVSRLDDPANPAARNRVTGVRDLSSLVYVPYNAEKANTDQWADRSLELPSEGAKGTYLTTGYVGADGTTHGLAVYLPAGYDENRAEPYKVLYISHGTGGDLYGEEMRWLNEGAVCNVNDNLGLDYVVVGMNNQEFATSGAGMPDWDFTKIEDDQLNYIMPFVEEHFNVCTEASGRAYAGLSMGGATTSNFLMYDGDVFGWYGIWSYANTDLANYCNVEGLVNEDNQAAVKALDNTKIMIAYGSWDFGMAPCQQFGEILTELGVDFTELEVPAAHDWENWQLVYAWAAQNFLFK